MKTLVAAIAVLVLLAPFNPVRADEEPTAREIEARLGPPQAREFVPCAGQDPRDQARCVRWQYDQGTLHTSYWFDVRTQKVVEVAAWDESTREASVVSEVTRTIEPSARIAVAPR
jgi:hypothetical protein